MSEPLRKSVETELRRIAKAALLRVPSFRRILAERESLRKELSALRTASAGVDHDTRQFVPPGHFFSPIPSLSDVRSRASRLFGQPPRTLAGIDLRESAQLSLLHGFQKYYDTQPFPKLRTGGRRYFFENPAYSYSDAIFLHCMIRHARPKRIIEIGSGYSSMATLDVNELFFEYTIECTFIEPYPDLLRLLLRPGDEARVKILPTDAQSVDLTLFDRLGPNDILFIDSTHVSKVGSDINWLFFEVLPRLAPGVYVHFHDIFYPFEYPSSWIYEGRAWSEAYLLRSFLTFNRVWEIVFFNTFLEHFHETFFREHMPLCLAGRGGSIWLRRRCEAAPGADSHGPAASVESGSHQRRKQGHSGDG